MTGYYTYTLSLYKTLMLEGTCTDIMAGLCRKKYPL